VRLYLTQLLSVRTVFYLAVDNGAFKPFQTRRDEAFASPGFSVGGKGQERREGRANCSALVYQLIYGSFYFQEGKGVSWPGWKLNEMEQFQLINICGPLSLSLSCARGGRDPCIE